MFTTAFGRDDAAIMTPVYARAEYDLTAGAGTDNAEQTCATIDLRDDFGTRRFGSLTAVVAATTVLAEAKTLTVSGIFEHSTDDSAWVEIGTDTVMLTLAGPSGGATVTGSAALGCNLAEAERFVRFKFKPDLSASGTDTAKVEAVYLLTSPTEV